MTVATPTDRTRSALVHRDIALVIDDDDQVLRLVKRVLERAGFECVTVNDGSTAHEAAVEWRPDIILLDLMLGDTTGDQIMAELREDFRTRLIPVVFLTVRDSLKDKVEHLLSGADAYVTKPFVPEALMARLRAVMSRSTTMAEMIATAITKRFDEAIPALYDPIDRDRGWIESEERSGSMLRTPLVSVSIGIVIAEPGSYGSAAAVAARASEVKGVAKRMPGSKWVLDRRRPPERFS